MTKVEEYRITKVSASQMALCVFACCSATEQKGQCVLCTGTRNMVTFYFLFFLRKEKETFCKVQTPFSWWKIVATAIIMF